MRKLETWLRFVKKSRFCDLLAVGATAFERRGSSELDAVAEKKTFETEELAAAHVRTTAATLRKRGWEEYGTIERPAPLDLPSDGVRRAKQAVRTAWKSALDPLRAAYAKALGEAGLQRDPSFDAQAAPGDADELARRCLALAEAAYGVEFARACFDDVEHMTGGWPVPDDEYARFYGSPARVAEIAEKRLAGKLGEDDGRFPRPRARARQAGRGE